MGGRAAALAVGLHALSCAPLPESTLPRFATYAASLPRDSASAVPYEPERLGGRVVLVTFIASWCFPCLTDLATLDKLDREYGAKGFSNVLVGVDLEGREVLAPLATGYALRWPLVVADERLRSGGTPFGRVRELPARVLFARDGTVVAAYTGLAPYEALAKVVAAELKRR